MKAMIIYISLFTILLFVVGCTSTKKVKTESAAASTSKQEVSKTERPTNQLSGHWYLIRIEAGDGTISLPSAKLDKKPCFLKFEEAELFTGSTGRNAIRGKYQHDATGVFGISDVISTKAADTEWGGKFNKYLNRANLWSIKDDLLMLKVSKDRTVLVFSQDKPDLN